MGTYTVLVLILLSGVIYYGWRSHVLFNSRKDARAEKEQIAFLLENLHDGLIEYNEHMSVVRMNRSAESLIGVKASDISGRKITIEDAKNEAISTLAKVTYPILGDPESIEKIGDAKNSKIKAEVHNVSVTTPRQAKYKVMTVPKIDDKTDTPEGYIKIVRDITKEDLISHSKSDLVAVVAHQLRTPLSGMRWILAALKSGDYGTPTEAQAKLLERGLAANKDMSKLIDDVLDLSKIEEARFEYSFKEDDYVEMVKQTIKNVRDKANTKQITLATDLPANPVKGIFDSTRLQMVVNNLLDNAISYTPEKSSISVKILDEQSKVTIEVRDGGIGIPKENQEKIFNKFFRAPNAQKVKTHGTGLGLFLAKTIVDGHGGKIWFESEEGKGTTFFIEIPKNPESADLAKPEKNTSPDRVYGF